MIKKYKYILILALIISILLYISFNNIESFTDAYIKKPTNTEGEYLYPILKNIFNEKLQLVDSHVTYDLIILRNEQGPDDNKNNNKYIYMCGEKKEVINRKVLNDPNCIAMFIIVVDPSLMYNEKVFYLPFFLNIGPIIPTTNPFVRNTNKKRERLAAYIAHHSPPHRTQMFKALRALDDTVDGLGKADHTNNGNIPEGTWWALPEVYKDYKFGFAMENADQDGYITEKIMNVYRGGAIPIFWGTSTVKEIFNPDSFIYVNDYPSFEDAAKHIVAIGNDPELYELMINAPIFLENSTPDYSKYYDIPSPEWVVTIANKVKNNM